MADQIPYEILTNGDAYRATRRADGAIGGYPVWHGWALMDCYVAGYRQAIADAAKAVEQTEEVGDYHWDGEDSVWSSDAQATLKQAAENVRRLASDAKPTN